MAQFKKTDLAHLGDILPLDNNRLSSHEILVLLGAGASLGCGYDSSKVKFVGLPKAQKGFFGDFPKHASFYPWLSWAFLYLLCPQYRLFAQGVLSRQIQYYFPRSAYKQDLARSERELRKFASRIHFKDFELEEVAALLETFASLSPSAAIKKIAELALIDLEAYISFQLPNPMQHAYYSQNAPLESVAPSYHFFLNWLSNTYSRSRICTYNYDTILDYESLLLQKDNLTKCSHYLGRLAVQYGMHVSKPILDTFGLPADLAEKLCIPHRAPDPHSAFIYSNGQTPRERQGAVTSTWIDHVVYKPHGSLDELVCRDKDCRSYLKPISRYAPIPGNSAGNGRCPDCRGVLSINIKLPIPDKSKDRYPSYKSDIMDVRSDLENFTILCIGYSFPTTDWATKALVLDAIGWHEDTLHSAKADVVVVDPRESPARTIAHLLKGPANIYYIKSGFKEFVDVITNLGAT